MKSGVVAAVLTGLALLAPACSDKVAAPTPSSANQQVAVESFTGTLAKTGFSFYSFTVTQSGPVSLVLLSLVENSAPSTAAVLLTLGVPRGTDCLGTSSVTVGVGVSAQLSISLDPLIYCARIADVGNLTAPSADFAINITRPR